MNKRNVMVRAGILVLAILSSAFALCTHPSLVRGQTTSFTISQPSESTFGGKFMGFGAELDPFFWNTPNTDPEVIGNPRNISGVNETDWQIITQRIKDMKIPIVRMAMQLGWATRDPDLGEENWQWNNPQMQSVFRYLDFACSNNIEVIIDDWAWTPRSWDEAGVSYPNCNTFPNNAGCYPNNNGYVDETDVRFARGIARYMKEFIDNRGYTCVKYLAVANEPEYEFAVGDRTYEQTLQIYETMIRNVNNELIANGVRSKIKFIGPGTGGGWDFLGDAVGDLRNIFDIYDFHRYPGPTCPYPEPPCSGEITNINPPAGVYGTLYRMLSAMRDIVQTNDPATGNSKQMFVTEMGIASGDSFTAAGKNEFFEYGLQMADYATTLLSTQVQGGTFWNMFDVYYSLDQNIYWDPPWYGEYFFQWGLWKYKDNNWALRPAVHSWGMVTRFAQKNSIQAAVNGCPPCSSYPDNLPPVSPYRVGALKRPDGGWSVFMVNETKSGTTFTLQFPLLPGHSFSKYQYDRSTFSSYPTTVAIPPVQTNVPAAALMTIAMPSESFIVLVENTVAVTPSPTSIPTHCTPLGNINCNGKVDILDLSILLSTFGSANTSSDLNNNGKVDIGDLSILLSNFGRAN
jgi:hypothetical protein